MQLSPTEYAAAFGSLAVYLSCWVAYHREQRRVQRGEILSDKWSMKMLYLSWVMWGCVGVLAFMVVRAALRSGLLPNSFEGWLRGIVNGI